MSFIILFTLVLASSLMSAESLVPVLIGWVGTMGLTQWLKNQTGLAGIGAMLLSFAISLIIGLIAFLGAAFLSGEAIEWQYLPGHGLQIFALASLTYRTFIAGE